MFFTADKSTLFNLIHTFLPFPRSPAHSLLRLSSTSPVLLSLVLTCTSNSLILLRVDVTSVAVYQTYSHRESRPGRKFSATECFQPLAVFLWKLCGFCKYELLDKWSARHSVRDREVIGSVTSTTMMNHATNNICSLDSREAVKAVLQMFSLFNWFSSPHTELIRKSLNCFKCHQLCTDIWFI